MKKYLLLHLGKLEFENNPISKPKLFNTKNEALNELEAIYISLNGAYNTSIDYQSFKDRIELKYRFAGKDYIYKFIEIE